MKLHLDTLVKELVEEVDISQQPESLQCQRMSIYNCDETSICMRKSKIIL